MLPGVLPRLAVGAAHAADPQDRVHQVDAQRAAVAQGSAHGGPAEVPGAAHGPLGPEPRGNQGVQRAEQVLMCLHRCGGRALNLVWRRHGGAPGVPGLRRWSGSGRPHPSAASSVRSMAGARIPAPRRARPEHPRSLISRRGGNSSPLGASACDIRDRWRWSRPASALCVQSNSRKRSRRSLVISCTIRWPSGGQWTGHLATSAPPSVPVVRGPVLRSVCGAARLGGEQT